MKKILIIITSVFTLVAVTGCKKDRTNDTNQNNNNPLGSLVNLWNSQTADFFVTVSSSYGVSLIDDNIFSPDRASTIIEAASAEEINVGSLFVNNFAIPFEEQHYSLQSDSATFMPSTVLGIDNHYHLSGSNFPTFDVHQYSPNVTNLTYQGLVNNKLPRNTSLSFSWTPDNAMPQSSRALIILYAEDEETGLSQSIEKEVNDAGGAATIAPDELALFDNYPYVRVFYAKGYNEIHHIDDKTIDFRFVNFSYSRIYFSDVNTEE